MTRDLGVLGQSKVGGSTFFSILEKEEIESWYEAWFAREAKNVNWMMLLLAIVAFGFGLWHLRNFRNGVNRQSGARPHVMPSSRFSAALNLTFGVILLIWAIGDWLA